MSWRISRGDPGARVVGRARRVFNHVNPNCTYENLRVYANGRISSGQGSWIDDLPRFREDLSSGKISASPIRRDRPQDRDVHLTGKGWLSGPGRLTRAEYVALTSDESLWLWVEETIAELARDCAVRGATGFHNERKTGRAPSFGESRSRSFSTRPANGFSMTS